MRTVLMAILALVCWSAIAQASDVVLVGMVEEEKQDFPSAKDQFVGYTLTVKTNSGTPIASTQTYRLVTTTLKQDATLRKLVGKRAKIAGISGTRSFYVYLLVESVWEN